MADSQELVPHLQKYSFDYIGFLSFKKKQHKYFFPNWIKNFTPLLLYVGSDRMVGLLPYLWLVLADGVQIQIYLIFLILNF